MALEIAPAPAKAPPAKASTPSTSGRNEVAESGSRQVDRGKSDKAVDPAGFLALLMGLDQDSAPEVSLDPIAKAEDTTAPDARDVQTDLMVAAPEVTVATPISSPSVLPGIVLPELHQSPVRLAVKPDESIDAMTLAVSDKGASEGRRRMSVLADTSAPMGTQQLQTQTGNSKEPSAKLADLMAAREGKAAVPAARQETLSLQLPASLQAPLPSEEARRMSHMGQAKVEVADNLVVLSSGLSGAMSTGGLSEAGSSGNAAQFQSVVAQEVAYYVSRDVQSAEMKLEGVGGGPVEVSINMQGQEAQVVFRTNELQTREMLEGATAQLKDMLQQQGVLLTGVFIGSSGAGDPGQQQERRFRQGPRSETTLRVATPEIRNGGVPAVGVGRTLDLFV